MQRLKEAMALLAANNGPLSPEWKDHALTGKFEGYRECHAKGDLLLVYKIEQQSKLEVVVFTMAGTHSELFGR
jgi:mRNA interferase YafQ